MPAVSVIMPVSGNGAFLGMALDSILEQTGVSFEVVCVDDGLAEPARRHLQRLAARLPTLRIIANASTGISSALNQGIAAARGRFLARMDADDVCLPNRLAIQAAYLEAHPALGVLGSQAWAIDADGNVCGVVRLPVGVDRVVAALETGSPLLHPTVMMRRDLLLEAGGYNRAFDGAEDYELWLRLSRRTNLDNLARPLLLYRRHDGQTTRLQQFRQARLAALALAAHRMRPAGSAIHATQDCWMDRPMGTSSVGPSAWNDLPCLAASFLVDNGGTLRASGARYLRGACRRAAARGSPDGIRRITLACVRHQLQLIRAGRHREALTAALLDLLRWRSRLLLSYTEHASILWRIGARAVFGRRGDHRSARWRPVGQLVREPSKSLAARSDAT